MKAGTYEKNDVVPLMLVTLRSIRDSYLRWAMKYAAEIQSKDLKGRVYLNNFEKALNGLAEAVQESVECDILVHMAIQFDIWVQWFIDTQSINFEELLEDERIREMSEEFLQVFYGIGVYYEFIDVDREVITYAMAHAVYSLCEVVILGSTDLDDNPGGKTYLKVFDHVWEEYEESEIPEYQLVACLAQNSFCVHMELIDPTNRFEYHMLKSETEPKHKNE